MSRTDAAVTDASDAAAAGGCVCSAQQVRRIWMSESGDDWFTTALAAYGLLESSEPGGQHDGEDFEVK